MPIKSLSVVCCLSFCVALSAMGTASADTVWNWTNEYEGDAVMPDGAWSYCWDYDYATTPQWFKDMSWNAGRWEGNNANNNLSYSSSEGKMEMVANKDYWTILRWQTPAGLATGTVDLHLIGSVPGYRNAYLELLDSTTGDSGAVIGSWDFTTATLDLTVQDLPVSAGDSYYLRVRANTSDSGVAYCRYDTIELTHSAVPEPRALVMMAAGLLGLLAYAWRKRK